jgi:DNA-binding NarL/FixJ family response regulator
VDVVLVGRSAEREALERRAVRLRLLRERRSISALVQRAGESLAVGDVELAEHVVEVVSDGARAEEQLGGAGAFAERARIGLLATGERARQRTTKTETELTAQEAQIARLVSEGESNRDIAAQLFLSPSTVDYHLRKVFRKAGLASRTQLAHVLADDRL